MKKPGSSFSSENTSQKMFIGTDKISEIVNDSDSDGGSFSELSDSDMCKVSSPFGGSSSSSSSEEQEVVRPVPDRGTKRKRRTLPKRTNIDFELGWKEKIQAVQKPAFSGVPGINKNFQINRDSSPLDIFEIFFSPEMFKHIHKETNQYAKQQINKKKQEGSLSLKSVFALWNSLPTRNKKILCDNHTHERVTQVIFVGLLEFASDYSHPICSFRYNVTGQVFRNIDHVSSK